MRASTANRILLWIVGGIGVFALLLLVAGDPDARDVSGAFVALAVTAGGLWRLRYRYRVLPRRESFEGQASESGLRARPGDPNGLLELPFTLFRWIGSVREIENTAVGTRGGTDLAVADYWFAPTADTSRDDYERYTCVLAMAPSGWADLSVVPERIGSRLRSAVALPDVRMESDAFNRRFEVRATDRRFASAFLDQRMMGWLLEQAPGMGFEVLGGRLMVFRPRQISSPDDLARTLDLFDEFVANVPRVIGSLYPDVPSRPDRPAT